MAPPDGGMTNYARREQANTGRADSPSGVKTDLSDLKVANPNTSATRTHKKDKTSKRSKPHSQHAQGNGNGAAFYDTDASDADRTSTTTSVRRGSHAAGQHSQSRQPANGQQRSGNVPSNYAHHQEQYPPNDSQANDLDDLSERWLADANAAEAAKANAVGKPQPPAFAQTYVQGDSYPPTTSGADRKSVV